MAEMNEEALVKAVHAFCVADTDDFDVVPAIRAAITAYTEALQATKPDAVAVERAPDFIYNPDDWEYTHAWSDRTELVDDCDIDQTQLFCTLIRGPDKWVAKVPTSWDDDGCPDEWELQWFDSETEAKTAAIGARSQP